MQVSYLISRWVDSHEGEYLKDLERLIAVKSVREAAQPGAPFGPGPKAALEEALRICEAHGFKTTNYENYVGTADMNDKPTALDILAHLDVVGEGDGWDSDPYKMLIKDGLVYGRGTDDDKGPALMALYAMKCVRELGLPMAANCRLILGTDEESGSEDLEYYYAKERPAPHSVTPDTEFPVYNTERGGYKPVFTRRWAAESAVPRVSSLSGGYRINVLPADASAIVVGLDKAEMESVCAPLAKALGVTFALEEAEGGVKLSVTGKASHAAHPEEGVNGITALIAMLLAMPLAETESKKALSALKECFPHGDGAGKGLGIAMGDEVSGDLTVAFSLLSMDETGISGQFDSRVPLCATEENCKAVTEAKLGGFGFAVSGEMAPCHHTPAESPFVKTLLRSYEHYTGKKGECLSMGGGTYVHDVPGGVAFGAGMPGFVSNLHGANERAEIRSLLTAMKIYAQVIYDLCKEG